MRTDYLEDRIDLLAPGLIRYEIGNALRFHPGSSPKELADAVKTIADMQIDRAELAPETVTVASEIAFQEGITFYDAVYIALAERNMAKLLTDDLALYRKASRKRNLLQLLKDYKSPQRSLRGLMREEVHLKKASSFIAKARREWRVEKSDPRVRSLEELSEELRPYFTRKQSAADIAKKERRKN